MRCGPDHLEKTKAGKCAVCNRLRAAEWYRNNFDRAMASRLKWARANRNKTAKYKEKHLAVPGNKEKSALASKKWKDENPERRREHCREWRARNPEKAETYQRNRRARLLSADGSHSAEDVADILRLQGGKCAYCRCRITGLNRRVDHIKPLAKGGANYRANLQILCASCNSRKSASDPVDFARRLGRLV